MVVTFWLVPTSSSGAEPDFSTICWACFAIALYILLLHLLHHLNMALLRVCMIIPTVFALQKVSILTVSRTSMSLEVQVFGCSSLTGAGTFTVGKGEPETMIMKPSGVIIVWNSTLFLF